MAITCPQTRRTYTPPEKARRRLAPGGAGGGLRNDSVPPAQPGMDMLMDMVAS